MNKRDFELAKPWEWLGTEGWTFNHAYDLQKFADLIRADEREICAKLCEDYTGQDYDTVSDLLAEAIRARGNK